MKMKSDYMTAFVPLHREGRRDESREDSAKKAEGSRQMSNERD